MKEEGAMENIKVSFDKEKFKQLLHYIIHKSGNLDNVGKTVLYKMMYFSDFDFYELYDKPITGEKYVKLSFGPAPTHFDSVVEELKEEGKVEEKDARYGNFPQKKIIPLCEPKLSLLNGDELKIVDKAIQKLSGMSASGVTAYSHEDLPWKATKDGEEISYELVFYRDNIYSLKNNGGVVY